MDFMALAQTCAPTVSPVTIHAIISVESSFNPYAIGVVDGQLDTQPEDLNHALDAIKTLEKNQQRYSVGLMQIHQTNLKQFNVSVKEAFDPCTNMQLGARVLTECYQQAKTQHAAYDEQRALRFALSCYYSGNFKRGFETDPGQTTSYVKRVLNALNRFKTWAVPSLNAVTPSTTPSAPVLVTPDENHASSRVVF